MTINQRLIAALSSFGDPVAPDMYTGSAERYFTFNFNTFGALHGDDAPGLERYLVQVHFFCPREYNSLARRKAIKQAIFAAGFTWPDEINAFDADGQHFVFECEDLEGVEMGG